MKTDEALALLMKLLRRIAPEVDPSELVPEVALHELGDLDSMDFLNLMTALFEATGLDVPERDYPRLSTVGGFVDYVAARVEVAVAD
jgi:acyl carrier protein